MCVIIIATYELRVHVWCVCVIIIASGEAIVAYELCVSVCVCVCYHHNPLGTRCSLRVACVCVWCVCYHYSRLEAVVAYELRV